MNVYILLEETPFEGEKVLGVYFTKDAAETQRDIEVKKTTRWTVYNEFNIEEHEVKPCLK